MIIKLLIQALSISSKYQQSSLFSQAINEIMPESINQRLRYCLMSVISRLFITLFDYSTKMSLWQDGLISNCRASILSESFHLVQASKLFKLENLCLCFNCFLNLTRSAKSNAIVTLSFSTSGIFPLALIMLGYKGSSSLETFFNLDPEPFNMILIPACKGQSCGN
ncbi:predicted protein [Clavispora lusitaniae ATCC 42720]|uniref:Uncharacterized protein n=1 Tax=Clavispora lusitaniae (strain ATCC 42720) TaxID=306902 RepID=C4Y9L0_CLAL4|nr:uncharacterized protein CLUG_04900 [Clavispora lusitaniae ATCC 42720]EEQ40772.1 predicted protein [Clavispora lusitaniae ATCC 42720]